MPATEAQIRANQANGARSRGPKTDETKARSRANAYKHGLTGAGVVLPEADAAEVERLSRSYRLEMKAEGEVGHVLAHRMAIMTVRMERCFDQQTLAMTAHVRQVLDEFEVPEGVDAAEAERLRAEAGRLAMFDTSKEANLARKYEASAERCFFRALKELQQLKKTSEAPSPAAKVAAETRASLARLGSFFPEKAPAPAKPAPVPSVPVPVPSKPVSSPPRAALADWDPSTSTHFDLPIAIGRAR